MGNGLTVVKKEDVCKMPQYFILGGDSKFDQLADKEGRVALMSVSDPYTLYGGTYKGDIKDAQDFKYLTFDELPNFSASHKSLMRKYLTKELFLKLKNVKTSRDYTLSNVIMTGVVTPHLG
jgi:hypothetical protein